MKKLILLLTAFLCLNVVYAQRYWQIDEGSNSITWQVKKGETHHDHIEMSGKLVSVVLRYGINKDGAFDLNKSMVWPMLRIIPNNTHGSLMRRLDWNPLEDVMVEGRAMREQVKSVTLNGTLVVVSDIQAGKNRSLSLKRTYLPSVDLPSLVEIYEFTNTGTEAIDLEIPKIGIVSPTNPKKGVEGSYYILCTSADGGSQTLLPGKTAAFSASVSAAARPGPCSR